MFVRPRHSLCLAALLLATASAAQTPVDADGNAYSASVAGASIETFGDDSGRGLSSRDLETLVGPVALYPDALLAIILPASAYPLQIVQAARFVDALEDDPSLTPSPDWDESVVALTNYPDIVRQLADDIDWTLELGEAVIGQQADVLAAVQRFRDRAYVAGNLKSDSRQRVSRDDSIIEIEPADDSILYVPVYEPTYVTETSARPVYSYRPDPYPVYYYPYPDGHAFRSGFFWGLTSAYALGWQSHRVHIIHHSFPGHPYYGHFYSPRWWYRRPTLVYHNRHYYRNDVLPPRVRNRVGDYWIPRATRYSTFRDNRSTRRNDSRYRVRRHPDIATMTNRNRYTTNRRPDGGFDERRPPTTAFRRGTDTRRSAERAALPTPGAERRNPDRRARTPGTGYRPNVVTRPSERAATYRRNEPQRQAMPKRYSSPPATRQATPGTRSRQAPPRPAQRQAAPQRQSRQAPTRPAARQAPSQQRQARPASRSRSSGNRETARSRLRRD